jgi:hypothetical protein
MGLGLWVVACEHNIYTTYRKSPQGKGTMPGGCAARPPEAVPGRAFRRRLRGWEQRELAQLASALGASGAASFRVHGVHVNLVQHASEAGAEQQHGQPAAAPGATADSPPSRRQQKRRQRSAARAAAFRERRHGRSSSKEEAGANLQPLAAAAPEPADAVVAHEQCSGQEGSEAVLPPPSDPARSPTRSPERKRQAIARCSATDFIASGSFGPAQVVPTRARMAKTFAAFAELLEQDETWRGP